MPHIFQLPLLFRLPLLRNLPLIRELPVRLIGFGIRREHVAGASDGGPRIDAADRPPRRLPASVAHDPHPVLLSEPPGVQQLVGPVRVEVGGDHPLVGPRHRGLEVFELAGGRYRSAVTASNGTIDVPGCEGLRLDLDALWSYVDAAR